MKRLACLFSWLFCFCWFYGDANAASVLVIQNTSFKNFADLIREHPDATEIEITDSTLFITPGIDTGGKQIIINNGVGFIVRGINRTGDIKLLSNVENGSGLTINFNDVDSMYTATRFVSGHSVYVHTVRQTNYSIVLGGNVGTFLDDTRSKNPNDKLLLALDSATNRAALNGVMHDAVRLNPQKVIDSVGIVNPFVLNDWDGVSRGFGLMPMYIYSGDYSVVGANADFSFDLSNALHATVGAHFGKIRYSDAYDDWNGAVYGGNVGILYQDNDVYVRTIGALSVFDFDGPNVYDGTSNGTKLTGKTGLGTVDMGPVFTFINGGGKIIPFLGGGIKYANVLNDSDTDFFARAGLNFEFNMNTDGNKYGYGFRTYAQSDGDIYAGIFSNMFSTADGIGGALNAGLLYNGDFGTSYKLSLDAKIHF